MVGDTLARVLEQNAASIVVTDRDGVIEYVNRAFEVMTGYTRHVALGRTPRLLRSGVQTAHFYTQLWNTVLAGQPFQATMTNRRNDGQFFDQEQIITPIRDVDGSITHFIATGHDVTARQRDSTERLEKELEREGMRVASLLHDELGQFLALAHMTLADLSRSSPLASDRLLEVRHYLDHVEERLRDVSRGVQPRVVADLGLIEAIRFLAKGCERRLGVPVTVTSPVDPRCPASIETLLYRVAQDALMSIGLHAGVTHVDVSITREVAGRRAADTTVCCSVTSEVAGPLPRAESRATPPCSAVIQRQLESVGGTLTMLAIAGGGSEMRVVLPVGA